MHRGVASLLAVAALTGSVQARAACDETYSATMFQDDLTSAEAAFRRSDLGSSKRKLKDVGEKLVCLDTVVDNQDLARFGRQLALVTFFHQDEMSALRWGNLSRTAAPDLPWHDDHGPDHPFRELIEGEPLPPIGGPTDVALKPPKKGAIFLDGKILLEPRAAAEVPHLVQIFDSSAHFVAAYWQDGAAFPDAFLTPSEVAKIKAPTWYQGSNSGIGGPGGPGSTSPVVPLAASGGLLVVSGILYAIGGGAKSGLKDATEAEELTTLRSRANWMVVGSTVTALGAVGIGVTGVFILDGNQVGGRFSVRF